ncbi:Crp/Fnr family transcriptional regulator [Algoriphagus sp. NG3]|uniref:Crp/Fnr family transcriptional regulator n=1 Tax=Algoriphagus sp. NG3 TaxID=3097546 RepID=UPI002A7F2020|nr:Crp/Fnr family transcriptional regulator [Algoriphagus sp. NG3]WPR77354.1 Crp/Fnr family transcriptional regulator [Algoriphagus sp. NG3]
MSNIKSTLSIKRMTEEKYIIEFKETVRGYYPVSDNAFHQLKDLIKFKTIKKDEILLNIGRISKHLYFVCKGAVIAYFVDEEGNTYNKNIFLEKQFAGSKVSALLKTPSQFTLQTIEDCLLISLDYRLYKELIYSNEELKNFYIAYLEKNWVIDKEQREISIVMEDATERYKRLLVSYPDIDHRIPLQHIASHLGITPTQLSRIRKNIKKNSPTQHM